MQHQLLCCHIKKEVKTHSWQHFLQFTPILLHCINFIRRLMHLFIDISLPLVSDVSSPLIPQTGYHFILSLYAHEVKLPIPPVEMLVPTNVIYETCRTKQPNIWIEKPRSFTTKISRIVREYHMSQQVEFCAWWILPFVYVLGHVWNDYFPLHF